jgi:MurNAc alpha-1-phosphate uridylyltransferase
MGVVTKRAMVMAAGFGTRMRPLTDTMPKPMVPVAGKPLIDHVLDRLAAAGVERAIVNVHYLADKLERHLASRTTPAIVISDERDQVLGTGGGVVKALPQLGSAPFFHVNSDTIWIEGNKPNFSRLAESFDAATMDALLLLAPATGSIGYDGRGDYTMSADGRLTRNAAKQAVEFVFAGAAILAPGLLKDAPAGAFSLTDMFDKAERAGRLSGIKLDGRWMHVGTPDAVGQAEAAIKAHAH